MDDKRYTVTVYAAAPGTPLRGEFGVETDTSKMDRSLPGHVFYTTSDGVEERSYGFGPVEHGDLNGPGKRFDDDKDQYIDPFYVRTMEVSRDQFDQLNEFGAHADHFGFDLTYKDIRNNCVDYTWAALNHAGIARTDRRFGGADAKDVNGKLNFLPSQAPKDIRTIRDPIPGSELNREVVRDRPAIEWWQVPLSEADHRQPFERDDPFERLHAAVVQDDNKAFDQIGQDYLQSNEGMAFLEAGLAHNRQQELAEQAMNQAQQQQAPAMRMTM